MFSNEILRKVGTGGHLDGTRKALAEPFTIVLICRFLGAFAIFRKVTISFVMSVCLSVCTSVRPHGTTRLPLN